MSLHGIEMVQIQVANWEQAVAWYQRVFRWPILVREDEDRWCLFAAPGGGCQLALYGASSVAAGTKNRCIPGVRVENLPDTIARLRAEFVPVGEMTGDASYRMATVSDPEGNDIHLYEWLAGGESH